jgi:hypothetical protein
MGYGRVFGYLGTPSGKIKKFTPGDNSPSSTIAEGAF